MKARLQNSIAGARYFANSILWLTHLKNCCIKKCWGTNVNRHCSAVTQPQMAKTNLPAMVLRVRKRNFLYKVYSGFYNYKKIKKGFKSDRDIEGNTTWLLAHQTCWFKSWPWHLKVTRSHLSWLSSVHPAEMVTQL